MEKLRKLEEKYALCQEQRKKEIKTAVIMLGIWAALLIPAVKLGTWLLWKIDSVLSSEIVKALSGFTLLIMGSFLLRWPIVTVKTMNNHLKKLTYGLSMELMAVALEETLGDYAADTVSYRVIQVKSQAASLVERNQRLAWRDEGKEFLVHRARITDTDADDKTCVCFDGMAFSLPVKQSQWSIRNNEKELQQLSRKWGDQLCIDGKTPIFSLDRIENRLWLSIGYPGLRLGEKNIPRKNLEQWYRWCSEDARTVRQIRDGLMKVVTET